MRFTMVWAAVLLPVPVLGQGVQPEPVVRLEADGPTSMVTAVSFSPDGQALYTTGWDKIVRTWRRDNAGSFRLVPHESLRVPIGPGQSGALNAMAVSGDGRFLAVAGHAPVDRESGFRQTGLILPRLSAMTDAMRMDQGRIYLFDLATREVSVRRGCLGAVVGLAFGPAAGDRPWLIAAAYENLNGDESRVVRAWGRQAEPQAGFVLPKETAFRSRPGLAAFHRGNEPGQLAVAIAWGDGSLRLWDVAQQTQQAVAGGSYNNSVAYSPESEQLITGSDLKLQVWSMQGGQGPVAQNTITLQGIPRAVAAFKAPGSKRTNRAAAIYRTPSPGEVDYLQWLDLDQMRTIGDGAELWLGRGTTPALAVAPDIQSVAIAGNPDHSIAVRSFGDPEARTEQKLHGNGKTWRAVSFVQRDQEIGLWLSETPIRDRGIRGGVILDFRRGVIVDESTDWLAPEPRQEWSAELISIPASVAGQAARQAVSVRRRGQEQSRIAIEPGLMVSDFAVAPPNPTFPSPVVALATYEPATGDPRLAIYDAATGIQVRQYTGHSARIFALNFSDDGRLLASVADDQTANVWSLVDLDAVVGKRGAASGVVLGQRAGDVLVIDAARDPAGLRPGDKLLGIVSGASREPVTGAIQFHQAIGRMRPGDTARVQISRGGLTREVGLAVGQAVDERKPLFTVHVSGDRSKGALGWVGWSPLGPYEASDRSVERLVGWHFNPPGANAPVSFAAIEEYRDEYYRTGLLSDLIARGRLYTSIRPDPLGKPEISLWLEQKDRAPQRLSELDTVRVQDRAATLRLSIFDSFPVDQLESITWQVAGVTERPVGGTFRAVGEREWAAELEGAIQPRATTPIDVFLRTTEEVPQIFESRVSLRYSPPAPAIQLELPGRVVRAPALQLTAKLTAGSANEPFTAAVLHKGKEIAAFDPVDDLDLRQDVLLEPGENALEIVARNSRTTGEFKEAETARQRVVVAYFPPSQPEIKIESITAVSGQESDPQHDAISTTVTSPRVRVRGVIRSQDEPLAAAELAIGNKKSRLNRFVPDESKEFRFDDVVELATGDNQVRITTKTPNSDQAESSIAVAYHPPAPPPVLTEPRDGLVVYEPEKAQQLQLAGRILPNAEHHPFQLALVVNNQEIEPGEPIEIDPQNGTFETSMAINPGENRIHLRTTNEWGSVAVSEPVLVKFLRPPMIASIKPSGVGDSPFADVHVAIKTPKDRPLVRVQVGSRTVDTNEFRMVSSDEEMTQWEATVTAIPLEQGDNRIELLAWNQDGACLEPRVVNVRFEPPPPAKAVVEILDPAADTVARSPNYSVKLRIASPSPVRRIELKQNGRSVHSTENVEAKKNEQGQFVIEQAIAIQLDRKNNALRVAAVNDGGEQAATATLSYVAQPVRVVLDRLQLKGRPDSNIPLAMTGGSIAEPAADAQVILQGRVIWPDKFDSRRTDLKWLHVRVNGLQQFPVELAAAADQGLERPFQAELWLHRRTGNSIELELPGIAQEAASRLAFKLDCRNPQRPPRLHLLVLGINEPDRDQLRRRALQAVQAQDENADHFATPVFASGQVYMLAGPWITRGQIVGQIERIRQNIIERKSPSDVVIIYYQGKESVDNDGRVLFHASDRTIGSDYLERFFANVPGAQILFLDVTRERMAISRVDRPEHMGVLRYAWQREGETPTEAQLLESLAGATSSVTRLVDIESYVSDRYRQLRERYEDALKYEPSVPESLFDLAIGAGASGAMP